MLFLRRELIDRPRAGRREGGFGQAGFFCGVLDRIPVCGRKDFFRVMGECAAPQQAGKVPPLIADGDVPTSRLPFRLVFPFEKMKEQDDQTAFHLVAVSRCHGREKLREVFKVHFAGLTAFGERSHPIEPGGFILLVERE